MINPDNSRVIDFDIKRTTKNSEICARLKKTLYNIVALYEDSTGYLQGMNFMVHYFMSHFTSDLQIV